MGECHIFHRSTALQDSDTQQKSRMYGWNLERRRNRSWGDPEPRNAAIIQYGIIVGGNAHLCFAGFSGRLPRLSERACLMCASCRVRRTHGRDVVIFPTTLIHLLQPLQCVWVGCNPWLCSSHDELGYSTHPARQHL